jgi:hypothetical protein
LSSYSPEEPPRRRIIVDMTEKETEELSRQSETLDLINSEVTARLAGQFDSADKIDTKASVLVGYAGAAATFLATQHAQAVVAILAYVAFGVAAAAGVWAYAVTFYREVPSPRRLFGYWVLTKAETLRALAATRVQGIEWNNAKLNQKVQRWWISLGALAVGMALMISAIASAH